jgi:THO complex subunit 1
MFYYQLMVIALFQFCDYGIEGVVPPELLPADVRAKFNSKPGEKAKRPKREDTRGTSSQPKEPQVLGASSGAYLG